MFIKFFFIKNIGSDIYIYIYLMMHNIGLYFLGLLITIVLVIVIYKVQSDATKKMEKIINRKVDDLLSDKYVDIELDRKLDGMLMKISSLFKEKLVSKTNMSVDNIIVKLKQDIKDFPVDIESLDNVCKGKDNSHLEKIFYTPEDPDLKEFRIMFLEITGYIIKNKLCKQDSFDYQAFKKNAEYMIDKYIGSIINYNESTPKIRTQLRRFLAPLMEQQLISTVAIYSPETDLFKILEFMYNNNE